MQRGGRRQRCRFAVRRLSPFGDDGIEDNAQCNIGEPWGYIMALKSHSKCYKKGAKVERE